MPRHRAPACYVAISSGRPASARRALALARPFSPQRLLLLLLFLLLLLRDLQFLFRSPCVYAHRWAAPGARQANGRRRLYCRSLLAAVGAAADAPSKPR